MAQNLVDLGEKRKKIKEESAEEDVKH